MKFSYQLIKKFVPGLESKKKLVEALSLHAFEAVDGEEDVFEVNLPPNRFSDAASHYGIAKEAAAIFKLRLKKLNENKPSVPKLSQFGIYVDDKKLCPRYTAQYFENVEIKPSPGWLRKALISCGLRPINNVVDIMNYVMLEVGEPLHAFDAKKLQGKRLLIRRAKKGDFFTSIDGVGYKLDPEILVVADGKRVQAIAGIKGGKESEITLGTERIIVEAANFDSVSVYKTSKKLHLVTDASQRFTHGLHPNLAYFGQSRAKELLEKAAGAKSLGFFDSHPSLHDRRILKFDLERFNHFIGVKIDEKTAASCLSRLGFEKAKGSEWQVPPYRLDIETHEDIFEEVGRLLGFNKLKPVPPLVALRSSESDEVIFFREKTRKILTSFGLDEVYTHSFISRADTKNFRFDGVPLENPISEEFSYLRPSLVPGLMHVFEHNQKSYRQIRIFETGKDWREEAGRKTIGERNAVGLLLASDKDETIFELKGVVEEFLEGLGIAERTFSFEEPEASSWIKSFVKKSVEKSSFLGIEAGGALLGYLGKINSGGDDWRVSVGELNLDKLLQAAEGEGEYEPPTKYPAVMRDVSFIVSDDIRIGEIMRVIEQSDQALIADVDLIDEYIDEKWENGQSITLRIVFRAKDRTLTSEEVDREMKKINLFLEKKFEAQIR